MEIRTKSIRVFGKEDEACQKAKRSVLIMAEGSKENCDLFLSNKDAYSLLSQLQKVTAANRGK